MTTTRKDEQAVGRTLADYRPQHDDDCAKSTDSSILRQLYPNRPCSCGLDALLEQAKERTRHGGNLLIPYYLQPGQPAPEYDQGDSVVVWYDDLYDLAHPRAKDALSALLVVPLEVQENKDFSAALLPADQSAPPTTIEALPHDVRVELRMVGADWKSAYAVPTIDQLASPREFALLAEDLRVTFLYSYQDRGDESPDSSQPSGPSAGAIQDGGNEDGRERADVRVGTHPLRIKQADKLRAVADWFTDCKTLTLENPPNGLIVALRAGADALEQIGSVPDSTEAERAHERTGAQRNDPTDKFAIFDAPRDGDEKDMGGHVPHGGREDLGSA